MVRSALTLMIAAALSVSIGMTPAQAQDKRIHVSAPRALIDTGFLKYLLPRFSLKHGVPVTIVNPDEPAQAQIALDFAGEAIPVFEGGGETYAYALTPGGTGNAGAVRLGDWLTSEIGRKAIAGFAGPPSFLPAVAKAAEVVEAELPGNVLRGGELSLSHCGRCHVIGEINRMKGIGSTPSFALLRTFEDWEFRFGSFYALAPHGPFTQIEELETEFPDERPPNIEPISLSLAELEDIVAYAASLEPANLGAPIKHQ